MFKLQVEKKEKCGKGTYSEKSEGKRSKEKIILNYLRKKRG